MSKHLKQCISILLAITLSLFSLTGFSSTQYIDNLAFVVALGIDVGENNNLKLSFQISIPSNDAGESSNSSESSNTVVHNVECSTIDSGINLINSYLSKRITLSHCKVIIFSEELAQKGLETYVYTLMNDVQIRPNSSIIISKNSVEDFLKNSKPTLEKLSARYYEIAVTSSQYTGYTDNVRIW